MADFVQTMKDWRRMCNAYTTDDESCCEGCRVVDLREHGCGAIFEMDDSTDWQRYADAIAAWAAENPEPIYPTWKEWLEEQRVVVHFDSVNEKGKKVKWELTNKSNCPIPADIAQKLGIEPKEG